MGRGKGVVSSMSTSSNVSYTHKKFKKAVAEVFEKKHYGKTESIFHEIACSSTIQEHGNNPLTVYDIGNAICVEIENSGNIYNDISPTVRTNNESNFSCSQCRCNLRDTDDVGNHNCEVPGNVDMSAFCQICMKVFKTSQDFSIHKCLDSNQCLTHENEISLQNLGSVSSLSHNSSERDCSFISLTRFKHDAGNTSKNSSSKLIYKPKFRAHYPSESVTESQVSLSTDISAKSVPYVSLSHQSSHLRSASNLSSLPTALYKEGNSISTPRSGSKANIEIKEVSAKVVSPQYPLIWKGIKSPSPEIVGKHINNLIVQNQAVVETHNPLWSMKYRRQSISGSYYSESDPSGITKACKLSDSLNPLKSYGQSAQERWFDSKFKPNAKVDFFNICSLPTTLSSKNSNLLPNRMKNINRSDDIYHHCFKENSFQNRDYREQEFVLNLHSDLSTDINCHQFSTPSVNSFTSEIISHAFKFQDLPQSCAHSNLPVGIQSPVENNEAVISNLPVYRHKRNDYCTLNTDISPLYGGEVKITDGMEVKTLKIDSRKRQSPSLDICFASKHMKSSQTEEQKVSTPVIVTIAKCGLNSGGTVVKVDGNHNTVKKCQQSSIELPSSSIFVSKENISLLVKDKSSLGLSLSSSLNSETSNVNSYVNNFSCSSNNKMSINANPVKSKPFTSYSKASSYYDIYESEMRATVASVVRDNSFIIQCTLPLPIYSSPIAIGDKAIPHVPGMPGPFSQPNLFNKVSIVSASNDSKALSNITDVSKGEKGAQNLLLRSDKTLVSTSESVIQASNFCSIKNGLNTSRESNQTSFKETENVSEVECRKLPEIIIESPYLSNQDMGKNLVSSVTFEERKREEFLEQFAKRPGSLTIKSQSARVCRTWLIGSTIVSPDTPRPKKSCAQLSLNGSAYTYLNLKVSTKTFYCCIYRPQPMYVLQSSDPKLSMYSNWQICETKQPLDLSPLESMGLHISGTYYNKAFTIAKSKDSTVILTNSSYRRRGKSNCHTFDTVTSVLPLKRFCESLSEKNKTIIFEEKLPSSTNMEDDEDTANASLSKKVKIFEGGFKTCDEYTYIRGRGRGKYVCETCGIRCKKPSMLKKHIRTHTDVRPFGCKHCSFSFKTKGNLTKHLKSKAHYKRCSEVGVDPIPVIFYESHMNQLDLYLQSSRLENESSYQNVDEDTEEEDDELEEDCDGDETDEVDEELISQNLSGSQQNDGSYKEHSPAVSKCTQDFSLTTETDIHYNSLFSSLMEGEDNSPIDLTIKRPFLTLSTEDESTKVVIPSLLLNNTDFSLANKEKKNSTSLMNKNEILSPITHSSIFVKSIYETTYKAMSSASSQLLNSEKNPVQINVCEGQMLQTYLTERAVLKSTRKRYQYLSYKLDPQAARSSKNGPPLTGSVTESSISPEHNSSHFVSSLPDISVFNPMTKVFSSEFTDRENKLIPLHSLSSLECKEIPTPIKQYPCIASKASLIENSSESRVNPTSTRTANMILDQSKSRTVLSGDSRVGSGRKFNIIPSLHKFEIGNSISYPPANLTVVSNFDRDTKPTFMAPSGVVPSSSSNRLLPDDGKCRCNVCHKEFSKQGQLRLHINIHYIERPHRCESCGISFRTNGHLQKHKRSVSHFNKVNMNLTFGTPSTDNPRPFKCHDCKIAFRIYGHLAKHLRSKLHIMKLECLGKLPFGIYAEIERSGVSLNEINTSDCENSLESLQLMATNLYEKQPDKLQAWRQQQQKEWQGQSASADCGSSRVRSISSSSNNSEDYPLHNELDSGLACASADDPVNEEDTGDKDESNNLCHSEKQAFSDRPSSSAAHNNDPDKISETPTVPRHVKSSYEKTSSLCGSKADDKSVSFSSSPCHSSSDITDNYETSFIDL